MRMKQLQGFFLGVISFFVVVGSGQAADVVTIGNLMWQHADNGQRYNWYEANTFCDGSTLAGYPDWRLPTSDELKGLVVCSNGKPTPLEDWDTNKSDSQNQVDATCMGDEWGAYTSPCINSALQCPAYAPGTWTSTTAGDGLAWNVHFTNGNNSSNDKLSYIGLARCVRDVTTVPLSTQGEIPLTPIFSLLLSAEAPNI